MTTRDTIAALAGDFYDELAAKIGTDGIDALADVADEMDDRWPDADDADEPRDRLNGAMMMAYGDATLESLTSTLRKRQAAADRAYRELQGAIVWAARSGATETDLHRTTGLARLTIRRILGRSK